MDPAAVARFADWPVNEADLHARHQWLVNQVGFRERMKTDPEYFDARVAGWWVWGISCWIGGGWCALRENTWKQRPNVNPLAAQGVHQKIPQVHPKGGHGVHRRRPLLNGGKDGPGVRSGAFCVRDQIPDINAMGNKSVHNSDALDVWFARLSERLRSVRVVCGDWKRVLGDTPLGLTRNVPSAFRTAVLLDPPYDHDVRDSDLYAEESAKVSTEVREWAIAHGADERLRIALCGYEGEHEMPEGWTCVAWKANGGYGNRTGNNNAKLERVWFSPHCVQPARDRELFTAEEMATP